MEIEGKTRPAEVIKYAGAMIAWVIGSGFATGQETLQFFAAFGYWSYAGIAVTFLGFILLGQFLMTTGYEHRNEQAFNHYYHYCGRSLGNFYMWLVYGVLLLLMPVLVSGAGATLAQYYGISSVVGTGLMTLMVLSAYLIGFERLLKVVSKIGPVIIIFSVLVGLYAVLTDWSAWSTVSDNFVDLEGMQAARHWAISGIIYLGLNFLPGSAYFVNLGRSAKNGREVKYGAIAGATVIVLTITIMNTAILLNAGETVALAVPVLFLAQKISLFFAGIFTIVLILGIFASCSAMMWSVCNRFSYGGDWGNRAFAVGVAVFIFGLGLLPFAELVGIFYPMIGYIGLIFIGAVIYKGFIGKKEAS